MGLMRAGYQFSQTALGKMLRRNWVRFPQDRLGSIPAADSLLADPSRRVGLPS